MKKLFFLFFLFFSFNSFAGITITDFKQDIEFTDYGKKVSVNIKAKVELKNRSYYTNGWSYIFDKSQKIEVSEAQIANRKYRSSFGNNELKFDFDKAFNGDIIELTFKYIEFDNDTPEYSKNEYVSLPKFAVSANGTLNVTIPDNYVIYSFNPKFKQNGNTYTWIGKIPQNGFSDLFYLTLKKAKWKAEVLTEITSGTNFSKIDVKIPLYFKNGNNKVQTYNITTNYDDYFAKIKEEEDNIKVNFDKINGSTAQIKVDAILENDLSNKVWIQLDPNKYLDIDEKLARQLNDLLYRISQDDKTQEPLYIVIAKWVNSNITYDYSYYGKKLSTMQILNARRGVCEQYAKLYNDLLRTAGIPSVMVAGMSYDTKERNFESHSWNLVYANGEWISVDPTWGLYSGILPISHIFFYLEDRDVINYTVYGASISDFKSDIKRNIEFLE
ncbi:MAG: transglutaminase-like domain-containing protein [Rickettsiales bacterium]|nr:transglutaminase-like domain-containing protein [Rickettsiales bacterium]